MQWKVQEFNFRQFFICSFYFKLLQKAVFQIWKWKKYWSELHCLLWQVVIMKRQEASEEFTWVNIQFRDTEKSISVIQMNWIIHRKYKCYRLIWSENTVKQVKTITLHQERQQWWWDNQGHCVIAHEQVTASVMGHKIGIHQPQSRFDFYQFYCFCLAVSEPVTQNYQLKTEVLLAGSSMPT